MSTINKVTGKKYRILKDATNKIWDEVSFETASTDVTFNDGMTAEDKVGLIKGLVTSEQSTIGYVMDATVTQRAPRVLTGTLRVGDTTLSFTDPAITPTAKIVPYTDRYGVVPRTMVTAGNTVTMTFTEQSEIIMVRLEISEFHS